MSFINSFGVMWNFSGFDEFVIGIAIYENASFLNHSCDPNCYVYWKYGNILCVRSYTDISKNHPTTITLFQGLETQPTPQRQVILFILLYLYFIFLCGLISKC